MAAAESSFFKCSRIAIIGAGSAGLIAAKYLRAEHCFSSLVIYEQRRKAAGLWQYTPHHRRDVYFKVPQVHADLGLEQPSPGSRNAQDSAFVTPIYGSLETNIPRQMMELSDFHFKSSLPLFPGHADILEYLEAYADDVIDHVLFEQQVISICKHRSTDSPGSRGCWSITSRNLSNNAITSSVFDAVVVGSGHYSVPYIPDIAGLAGWSIQYPGTISHSKYFRDAHDFFRKTVVVVGNSASGVDIAAQLSTMANSPVYLSQKSSSEFSAGSSEQDKNESIGQIAMVCAEDKSIVTTDGRVINGIDAILFCTGYFYSLPFLRDALPGLITDGHMVNGTFQHMFLASDPTMAFLALPQKVIPFPISEAQAAVVARVYAGRLSLPSKATMLQWEQAQSKACGGRDKFHTMGYPLDADYMDMLVQWADQADNQEKSKTLHRGKRARCWSARERWIRQKIPQVKRAYADRGSARYDVRCIEELGFDYEHRSD